ncbi:ECA1 gametogenesis related family protein [Quillaja saponaria]|uniref:ECA1 gametogenesis related family protein n=1 Tax=Quillaja saponaria TaxID=32244 RepID=A0AAD7LGD7_QUISA|nr:ECA1 gametogenesis related family protein [Quillaja saponaria]
MAMLYKRGLAMQPSTPEIIPFPRLGQTHQCWSSLTNIQGCVMEIYGSLFGGQFSVISPPCRKAITEINDNCWPKLFPYNTFFPPLLKSTCVQSGGTLKAIRQSGLSSIVFAGRFPFQTEGNTDEIQQCLSPPTNIHGCMLEIYGSLMNGRISNLAPSCCHSISQISDNCRPKLFPFNPYVPLPLKKACDNPECDLSSLAVTDASP